MSSPPPPRLPRSEIALTAEAVRIAQGDSRFTRRFAHALLSTAAEHDGPQGARARDLMRHLPRTSLVLEGEHLVAHPKLMDRLRDSGASRIDWVFASDRGFTLAVEVKIGRQARFQPAQLQNYDRALRELGGRSGVLALSPKPVSRADLLPSFNGNNLGNILWSAVEPRLRELTPVDPDAGSRWTALLDRIAA